MTIEELLEQHSHYEMGRGWTIGRRGGVWHVYFRAKHVDCCDAAFRGLPSPATRDLTSHATAVQAVKACEELKLVAEWALPTNNPDFNQAEASK